MSDASHDLMQRVKQAIVEHVGPALEMDGTQVEVLDVADGVARLRLAGICGSCPTSIMAAVVGIEAELRRLVPEIDYIEAVP